MINAVQSIQISYVKKFITLKCLTCISSSKKYPEYNSSRVDLFAEIYYFLLFAMMGKFIKCYIRIRHEFFTNQSTKLDDIQMVSIKIDICVRIKLKIFKLVFEIQNAN